MKTFIAWLIANICGVVDFFIVIVYEVLLFQGHIPIGGESDISTMAVFGPFLILMFHGLLVGGMPSKNVVEDIVNMVVLTLGYAIAWWGWKNDPEFIFMSVYAWGLIPSLALALIVAVFTANNIYEVVSRRMLFVNSNSNLFEMKLLYTFNRFIAAFSASSFVFLCIALLKRFAI